MLVQGTSKADSITNSGSNVTIKGLSGNDMIQNGNASSSSGSKVTIYGGSGEDVITNYGTSSRVYGGADNDSIDNRGKKSEVLSGAGDDSIYNTGTKSTVYGGIGNDTIYNYGDNVSIDAGAGENIIDNTEGGSAIIVFNGNTTVKGFHTGFGDGSDTVCFINDAPACDFKDEGLILYDDDGEDNFSYLVFDGVKNTTKLNLYYADDDRHIKEIFINYNEWYTVESEDFTPDNGATVETYFVGSTALPNEGIDFSSITDPLNVSLDTDYGADVSFWVNNIHSIIGGSGLTTITGSDKSDTIQAVGKTTIKAGGGDDLISGGKKADLIYGGTGADTIDGGSGKDSIYGGGGNDSIFGGGGKDYLKGGKGNDTLWGGAGNDTLYGNKGDDTFIYTANSGTDKIMDFASNDMLQILNADGSAGSFTKSKFSDGVLTLNIDGGGKLIFENVSTSTDFNINGDAYKISGSKLSKQ